ncbi:MAG: NAD(P)/FAD-dependent oxidoreductase [Rhodospirillaceae bacterium]
MRFRIVIVGGGFGGLTLLKKLRGVPADIVLVDRHNHHVFQPLLYQVATAALSPAAIAQPIRGIVKRARNITIHLDEAVGLDAAGRKLRLASGNELPYDMLVIATGVEYTYFGHPEWAAYAPSLKSLADATAIRSKLLQAFEKAEVTADPARQRQLLTFVLVGGGPTGVEMAGSIAELARFALRRDFSRIDPASARVVLVEAGPRLLNGFAPSLSSYALRALRRLRVEVHLSTPIENIDGAGVTTKDGRIDAALTIWCAGVRGTSAAAWLDVPLTAQGTVQVAPDLSVPGHPDIFVIGDLARISGSDRPLPQVAPVAKQQAAYLAHVVRARLGGRKAPAPFTYRDPGSLAIIGSSAAAVDFGWIRLTGFVGWLVWCFAHIFFLIGFRNRSAVFLDWAWEWLTDKRGARLITEEMPQASRAPKDGGNKA